MYDKMRCVAHLLVTSLLPGALNQETGPAPPSQQPCSAIKIFKEVSVKVVFTLWINPSSCIQVHKRLKNIL